MQTHHLSVDLEDWFHLLDTPAAPGPAEWAAMPSRVEANTHRLLDLFDEFGARATFFTLGWVADRYPHLVREVAARGHEVGSHGWGHVLVDRVGRAAFEADLDRSIASIGEAVGQAPLGYRAAGFSITPASAWAFESLAARGFRYDASVFPSGHAHGGFPRRDARPFRWALPSGATLWEFPVAAVRSAGRTWTFGGGGYFRLAPAALTVAAMRRLEAAGIPGTLYLHPRDLDPEQPRLPGLGPMRHFKSYVNLAHAQAKLRRVLRAFRFRPLAQGLSSAQAAGWPSAQPGSQAR